MSINRFFIALLCCTSLLCCSNGEEYGTEGSNPAVDIKIAAFNGSSVTLEIKTVNADHVRILCSATSDSKSQTAESVAANGTKYTDTNIVIGDLQQLTKYTVFAVACTDDGAYGKLQYAKFTTDEAGPEMYSWEKERSGILSFSDMVLCYGGSSHRVPFRWEKERFEPFVTYVNQQGEEQWLFDSFLCIEFVLDNYSLNLGQKKTSAGRAQWEKLINYWFSNNNGVNALEQAVSQAAQRIGAPSTKRKVIMTMPDPIIFEQYADMNTSTTYWGKLDGRRVDFAQDEDRVAVYKWFINEVRKRFDLGNYRHIELAGFYIVSEDLATPSDGWNPELKRWENVIPSVADYLHAINESLSWIPYNMAAGYKRWSKFGIDYAYMQPNHFWDDKGEKPLPKFFANIRVYNLAMEFEFDEALIEANAAANASQGKPTPDVYKQRLRNYMSGAISEGIYGTQPLSYYHGTNGFYDLWKSTNEKDKELYHEFCQFVIDNPLRK